MTKTKTKTKAMKTKAMKTKAKRIVAVGQCVLIRTVTHYQTGRITYCDDQVIELTDAAWIAETGRWANALQTGELTEVEPYGNPVSVNRGAISDVTVWPHPLPLVRKP